MDGGEELRVEAAPYCCSSCDGGEVNARSMARRSHKRKTRSLSTSSAGSSTEHSRRNQSLHGPSPVTTFGPKACMLQNPHTVMHIQDPASQKLTWNKPPKSVLVIKKIRDASLLQPFKELCIFLTEVKDMIVYVEKKVLEDPAISDDENFGAITEKFCTFRDDLDDISNRVDFIICLGGDGTLLYASSLFQESVPPVMAFHLGSLGFLTPFKFDTYQSQVDQVIEGNAAIVLRSRLKVRVLKENWEKKARLDEKGIILTNGDTESRRKSVQYQVLNEVVVDRGPSSYLSNVDLFLDGHLITTVQGDVLAGIAPAGLRREAATLALARKAQKYDWHILHNTTITPAPPSRLKSRHPYNKAAQEMLNSTSEDISRDAWLAAAWKQEWESAVPSRIHRYIWDPGDGAIGGDNLPRRQWTTLNRLRTGVGRFKT
ncbi:NAD kinase-like isoform X2 [Gymnodraco acuticeps]|uniref:NAD(+) kinase n=1 Tax=Gymnodraco acuticeps TaxID=8218 RepID=A0A6P8TFY6_GYMAC|nr:NAD kinase-like isoform X2 [Gymnodraco acuticeps]